MHTHANHVIKKYVSHSDKNAYTRQPLSLVKYFSAKKKNNIARLLDQTGCCCYIDRKLNHIMAINKKNRLDMTSSLQGS